MNITESLFSLTGKTALVTGGAGAIGTAMCETLMAAGARVIIWSRTQDAIDIALEKLVPLSRTENQVMGLTCDTGDEALVASALEESVERFGPADILINGVGGNLGKSDFVDLDVNRFEKVLHMNILAGLVIPTKVIARFWMKQGIKGCIINLTSMASYLPLSGVWAYGAAKSAVLNLTQATAKEFAGQGIRVNAIAPGFFIGKQNKALLIDEETGEYTDRGKAVIDHTPFGRFGDVSELAGATLFLASDKASGFVTGVSIPVDGGYLIQNI